MSSASPEKQQQRNKIQPLVVCFTQVFLRCFISSRSLSKGERIEPRWPFHLNRKPTTSKVQMNFLSSRFSPKKFTRRPEAVFLIVEVRSVYRTKTSLSHLCCGISQEMSSHLPSKCEIAFDDEVRWIQWLSQKMCLLCWSQQNAN